MWDCRNDSGHPRTITQKVIRALQPLFNELILPHRNQCKHANRAQFASPQTRSKRDVSASKPHLRAAKAPHSATCQATFPEYSFQLSDSRPHRDSAKVMESPSKVAILNKGDQSFGFGIAG
jgi:hypothetical protein